MENKTDSEIIDAFGGTGALAEICGLSDPAVSLWRVRGIPKPWRMFLIQTRPDIFGIKLPKKKTRKTGVEIRSVK